MQAFALLCYGFGQGLLQECHSQRGDPWWRPPAPQKGWGPARRQMMAPHPLSITPSHLCGQDKDISSTEPDLPSFPCHLPHSP